MKKQVILEEEEYERFINISSILASIYDETVRLEPSGEKINESLRDNLKKAEVLILYANGTIKDDMRRAYTNYDPHGILEQIGDEDFGF